jgi:hypothetical protein
LLKEACEGLTICRRSERHSVEPGRERLRATIRPSNAEIKPGHHFDRLDRADNIAGLVGIFISIGGFRKKLFTIQHEAFQQLYSKRESFRLS